MTEIGKTDIILQAAQDKAKRELLQKCGDDSAAAQAETDRKYMKEALDM